LTEDADMRRVTLVSILLAMAVSASPGMAEPAPYWAYPVNSPDVRPEPSAGTIRHVPDSTVTQTLAQVRDFFHSPDWHPDDHAPLPDVVAQGRRPDVWACGFCHRASGVGGPENANLSGLSVAYTIEQIAAFRAGTRATSEPKRKPNLFMTKIARAMTDEEALAAAQYFAGVPYQSVVDVVEADTVPKTIIKDWHLSIDPGGGTEPIGQRIIEIPADDERFASRDSRVHFTAYVPPGSIQRGLALATTGDGGTAACSSCHGADLMGAGPAPPIRGRSPSYVVRQLFDMREGNRTGGNAALMKPVVEHLTVDDMASLAAYVASLKPAN
jgi:cytochrome c553